MATENMIKFLRGNVANLPQTATAGALYFTKDEGVYLGLEDGSYHRYGDFITVADVKSLPATGAHATCMYYCTSENILARYDSEKGWIQINKQPTAEEMKTLLGLGSMAYKSEVAEGDLNADLASKINAASGAQHTHANKDLLDTYTQTEADLADAVAKKHSHANADELAKIVDGDKAKWDAVVADHLTSADKTTLENSIKEAKQAGTDANTNIEAYKVTNDARVKAVEDDIAEITDAEGGILAQAKSYSDGKLATARTEITAEIDADVKVVSDALGEYKTSNDAALAGVKATADAAAVKSDVDAALADRYTKSEADGKFALITDAYDDTELAGRVTVAEGKITALETESAKHATKDELNAVDAKFADYNTTVAQKAIDDAQDARIKAIEDDYLVEADIADFETKENVKKVADDLAAYVESNDAAVADRYTKEEADGKFALIADAYDDEEVRGLISDNADAIAAIEADYLKTADKTELEGKITANANAIELLTNGVSAEEVDGVNDLIQYVKDHGTEVTGIKADIAANAKAISDHEALAAETYETKDDAAAKLTEAKEYADDINTALDARLDTLEAINHEAYTAADAALKAELQAEIDADVKVVNDALEAYKTSNDAEVAKKANAADVYAKTETYTQAEVDALISAAHTWGEF